MSDRCHDFRELITRKLGDELTPDEARALDIHLASCAACATSQKASARTFALVRTTPLAAPSELEFERMLLTARQGARRQVRVLAAAAIFLALLIPGLLY